MFENSRIEPTGSIAILSGYMIDKRLIFLFGFIESPIQSKSNSPKNSNTGAKELA